ncbi:DUF3024 domain-containing protein [Nocardia mexicana]|uniref:DUF3024 domain-containing protein n=1 Tax=Nocardia mexicana TaxID=279262 RepID=UPI000A050823
MIHTLNFDLVPYHGARRHGPIPPSDLEAIERWCIQAVPEQYEQELRLTASRRGRYVTICECRPTIPRLNPYSWSTTRIAQLRFDPTVNAEDAWSLYWPSRRPGRWRYYPRTYDDNSGIPRTGTIVSLLAVVERDPFGCFF